MYKDKRKYSKIMFKTIVSRDKGCKNEHITNVIHNLECILGYLFITELFLIIRSKIVREKMNWQFQTKTCERKLLKNDLFSPGSNIKCSIRNFVKSAVIG